MKRLLLFFVLALSATAQVQVTCYKDYSPEQCASVRKPLLHILHFLQADTLNWKFVIVTPKRFRTYLKQNQLSEEAPALTLLDHRMTLMEESLITYNFLVRRMEIIKRFHIPDEDLLGRSVAHELTHVLFPGRDEQTTWDLTPLIERGGARKYMNQLDMSVGK